MQDSYSSDDSWNVAAVPLDNDSSCQVCYVITLTSNMCGLVKDIYTYSTREGERLYCVLRLPLTVKTSQNSCIPLPEPMW